MENKEKDSASRRRQLPQLHPGSSSRNSLPQSSSLRRTFQHSPAATHFASQSSAHGSRWGAASSSSYPYYVPLTPAPVLSQTLGSGGAAGGVGLSVGFVWEAGSSSSHQPQPPLLSETHGPGGGAGNVAGSSASWQSIYGSWWEASSSLSHSYQDQAPPSLVDQIYGSSGGAGGAGSAFPQSQENLSGSSNYEMPPSSHPEEQYPTSGGGVNGSGSVTWMIPCSTFMLWLDTGLHTVLWPPAYTTPLLSSSSVNQASSASGLLLYVPLPPPLQTTAVQPEDSVHAAAPEHVLPAIYLPPPPEMAYVSLFGGADLVSTYGVINTSNDDDTDNNTSTNVATSSPPPIPAEAMVKQEPVSLSPLGTIANTIPPKPAPVTSSSLPVPAEATVKQEPMYWSPLGTNTSPPVPVTSSSLPIPAQAMVKQEPVYWSPLGPNTSSSLPVPVTSNSLPIPSEAMVKQEPVYWSPFAVNTVPPAPIPATSSSLPIPAGARVKEEPVDCSPLGMNTSPPAPVPAGTPSSLPSPAYPMVKTEAVDWTWETSQLGTNTFSSGSSSNWMQNQLMPSAIPGGGSGAGSSSHCPWSSNTSSRRFQSDASDPLVEDFADGSFTESETKKITGEKRLAEIVHTNPKRVRSILQNRKRCTN